MNEKTGKDELRAEIERGHFVRAALLAESLGLSEEEIQDYRCRALWQMSAVNRNAPGTKILAQQYGFSKNQVREILESYAEKKNNEGDDKPFEPCYDHDSGKYLSFEEWMDYFLRDWNKLPVS